MLRLTSLARLLSRRRPKRVPTTAPRQKSTRLCFDQLETRESPATLSFVSPGGIYGAAALDGAVSSGVRDLQYGYSGNLAWRVGSGYPQSQAYSSMASYSGASDYKSIDVTTSAYTTNFNRESQAVARTTTSNSGGYSYLTLKINPSVGESIGQRVRVTLTINYTSTIGWNNTGTAYNSMSFYVNGTQYLGGTDSSKGTERFSRTVTITTTIGSTFQVAFSAYSYAGSAGGGMNSNVATLSATLNMSVQRI